MSIYQLIYRDNVADAAAAAAAAAETQLLLLPGLLAQSPRRGGNTAQIHDTEDDGDDGKRNEAVHAKSAVNEAEETNSVRWVTKRMRYGPAPHRKHCGGRRRDPQQIAIAVCCVRKHFGILNIAFVFIYFSFGFAVRVALRCGQHLAQREGELGRGFCYPSKQSVIQNHLNGNTESFESIF
jgi:hypothetical protein